MNIYRVSHLVNLNQNKLNEIKNDGLLDIGTRGSYFEISDMVTGASENEAIEDSFNDVRYLYRLYVVDSKAEVIREIPNVEFQKISRYYN